MRKWKWAFYVKPEPADEFKTVVHLSKFNQWIAQFEATAEDAKLCALKLSEGNRECYLMRDAECARARFYAKDGKRIY